MDNFVDSFCRMAGGDVMGRSIAMEFKQAIRKNPYKSNEYGTYFHDCVGVEPKIHLPVIVNNLRATPHFRAFAVPKSGAGEAKKGVP
ncbi:MAG: hypothetical protein V4505_03775 [Pseudomonadota bacterium]